LNDGNLVTVYHHELEAELPGDSEPEPLNLDNKWSGFHEKYENVNAKINEKAVRSSGGHVSGVVEVEVTF
jgi:hypothetical protein